MKVTDKAFAMATMCRAEIKPYSEKDFFDLENLGVSPPRKCDRCKKLKTDDDVILSCQEEEEFKMVEVI